MYKDDIIFNIKKNSDEINLIPCKSNINSFNCNDIVPIPIFRTYTYEYNSKDDNGKNIKRNVKISRQLKTFDFEDVYKNELDNMTNRLLSIVNENKKLDVLVNAILRYKSYNKNNLKRQLNKADFYGDLNKRTKSLVGKIYDRQNKNADELENNLEILLSLYDKMDNEIEQIKNQLLEFAKR